MSAIQHRITKAVLWQDKLPELRASVIAAVKARADLRWADLGGAYLRGADLRWADLGGAYLRGADLGGAYLRGADLRWADLGGAYLRGADLRGADLRWADLGGADLRGADLRGADLRWADLRGADLRGADLGGADLRGADLRGANLEPGATVVHWSSHALVAEILFRSIAASAGLEGLSAAASQHMQLQRRGFAGMVLISTDWCWSQFGSLALWPELREWALATLRPWVTAGDRAPELLTSGLPPAPAARKYVPADEPDLSAKGTRVVRGPDWFGGDQDGGAGQVGTVLDWATWDVGVVYVQWPNGRQADYRFLGRRAIAPAPTVRS